MTFFKTFRSSSYALPMQTHNAGKNAPIKDGRQIMADNADVMTEAASSAFAKFYISIADIQAAIRGRPNTVTSIVESINMKSENGRLVRATRNTVRRQVTLDLTKFIDNPRAGEKEVRRNDCLRALINSLGPIENCPGLPGHEQLIGSSHTNALLNRYVAQDNSGKISLRDLNNKETMCRVLAILSSERDHGVQITEKRLLDLIDELENFGRAYYPAKTKVLEKRLASLHNHLNAFLNSKDSHGAYNHKAATHDENEIAKLRKEIKSTKDQIFALHHQRKLSTGTANEKLEGRSTANRLFYAMKRRGASEYLKWGEITPLRDEVNRLISLPKFGGSRTRKTKEKLVDTHHPSSNDSKIIQSQVQFSEYIYSELTNRAITQKDLSPEQAEMLKVGMRWLQSHPLMRSGNVALITAFYYEKIKNEVPSFDPWAMLVGAMMLADIHSNDGNFSASAWAKLSGLSLVDVRKIKRYVLEVLEYRTIIKIDDLEKVYDDWKSLKKTESLRKTNFLKRTGFLNPENPIEDILYINRLLDYAEGKLNIPYETQKTG